MYIHLGHCVKLSKCKSLPSDFFWIYIYLACHVVFFITFTLGSVRKIHLHYTAPLRCIQQSMCKLDGQRIENIFSLDSSSLYNQGGYKVNSTSIFNIYVLTTQ